MKRRNVIIEIAYTGKDFFGIAKQIDRRTIQGTIEDIIKNFYKLDSYNTSMSSRTDKGVHALVNYMKITFSRAQEEDLLIQELKDNLPKDITYKNIYPSKRREDVRMFVDTKEYKYLFTLDELPAEYEGLVTKFSKEDGDFDPMKMNEIKDLFVGRRNFSNFQYRGDHKSPWRNVHFLEIRKSDQYPLENLYELHIKGAGFLKQMVRLITGTLVNYARGNVTQEEIEKAFEAKEKMMPGFITPPDGLYLTKIDFHPKSPIYKTIHGIEE